MRLADWVDEVKATGGIPEGDPDTLGSRPIDFRRLT